VIVGKLYMKIFTTTIAVSRIYEAISISGMAELLPN